LQAGTCTLVAAILLALNLLLHALQCDVHATLGCYVTMVTVLSLQTPCLF